MNLIVYLLVIFCVNASDRKKVFGINELTKDNDNPQLCVEDDQAKGKNFGHLPKLAHSVIFTYLVGTRAHWEYSQCCRHIREGLTARVIRRHWHALPQCTTTDRTSIPEYLAFYRHLVRRFRPPADFTIPLPATDPSLHAEYNFHTHVFSYASTPTARIDVPVNLPQFVLLTTGSTTSQHRLEALAGYTIGKLLTFPAAEQFPEAFDEASDTRVFIMVLVHPHPPQRQCSIFYTYTPAVHGVHLYAVLYELHAVSKLYLFNPETRVLEYFSVLNAMVDLNAPEPWFLTQVMMTDAVSISVNVCD